MDFPVSDRFGEKSDVRRGVVPQRQHIQPAGGEVGDGMFIHAPAEKEEQKFGISSAVQKGVIHNASRIVSTADSSSAAESEKRSRAV